MEWNFKDGIPIYAQIIDEMTMRIASNAYAPGEKLPSVRELAMDAGVNPNTMQRALAELERRGLVYSERTSGRFVTKEEEVLDNLHEELARKYFQEFAEKLRKIGMDKAAIKESIEKWVDGIEGDNNGKDRD
ncbi:MAG: GntR family transcriptional regulator [Clostridia bacterium]|nr:GntR family transcriptional regulator [Clostridia bacterium]